MKEDLTAPIGIKKEKKDNRFINPIIYGLAALVFSFWLFLFGWILIVDNPMGGRPTAVAQIDISIPPVKIEEEPDKRADTRTGGAKIIRTPQLGMRDPLIDKPKSRFAATQNNPVSKGLSTYPDDTLIERSQFGLLPVRAKDGTRPLDRYAVPPRRDAFATRLPKIAIVVGGLGLSQTSTQEAIRVLPNAVGLAFAPYGNSLVRWLSQARLDGHEIFLQIPMEPYDYPDNDPGPHTLVTGAQSKDNINRLKWLLSRITNYVGVINYMGGRMTADPEALAPIMQEMGERGLMYLDDGSSVRSRAEQLAEQIGVPFLRSDIQIDAVPKADEIDARLITLEQEARKNGSAIGIASALPVTLKRLNKWTKTLQQRGFALVPITMLVPR